MVSLVVYSHSRLQCFENCPKAYYFSYLEKPEVEVKEGIEAFMGSRVHETLEKHYIDLKFTKLNSLPDLLAFFDKQWKENWDDPVVIVKAGLKPKHYFELGKKCIKDYYERHKPFDNDKTIACEKLINLSLDDDGQYKMRGYIDRLAEQKPGYYVIHDYKTSGSLPLQDYIDQDRQLALYSIAVQNDFADCKEVDLCWHYLAFDKDLFSKRTEQQLNELKKQMISLIQQVEKAEKDNDFPARESNLCSWCQYGELCPIKKHATKVEKLPVKEFKKDAGVKFVKKFIELNGQKAEIESELEELKKDVFAYAEKFQLEKIVGSEAALKIYKSLSFSFAGLKKEEKNQLKEILENGGLLDDFLQLDTRALGSAVTEDKIEKEIAKQIKKFGEEKETKGIRLVKK